MSASRNHYLFLELPLERVVSAVEIAEPQVLLDVVVDLGLELRLLWLHHNQIQITIGSHHYESGTYGLAGYYYYANYLYYTAC